MPFALHAVAVLPGARSIIPQMAVWHGSDLVSSRQHRAIV